jgi:predicted nucleic acid-binding protein
MEAAVVLDTSITMAWCFDDEATPYTEDLLNWCAAGTAIHVASVWPLEVTNVLLNAQRKGRVTENRVEQFLDVLSQLPFHIDPVSMKRAVYDIRVLAQAHRLTSYDASYLELALRLGLPLASLDDDLKKAALASGVRLVST